MFESISSAVTPSPACTSPNRRSSRSIGVGGPAERSAASLLIRAAYPSQRGAALLSLLGSSGSSARADRRHVELRRLALRQREALEPERAVRIGQGHTAPLRER